MSEKLTEELLNELLFTSSLDSFFEKNTDLSSITLSQYLNFLLENKSFKKSEVIKKSGLNSTHAYEVFSGDKGASRNKVLQLAFAMKLNLRETQRLLKSARTNELYCKNKREAIIIYCINQNMSLESADDTLHRFSENTICDAS